MSFFDKVKQGASDAAGAVKENVREAKVKNEIVKTYEEIGRKVFELVEDGKLTNRTLSPYIKHLRELKKELAELDQPDYVK
jgi:hypothetical protein